MSFFLVTLPVNQFYRWKEKDNNILSFLKFLFFNLTIASSSPSKNRLQAPAVASPCHELHSKIFYHQLQPALQYEIPFLYEIDFTYEFHSSRNMDLGIDLHMGPFIPLIKQICEESISRLRLNLFYKYFTLVQNFRSNPLQMQIYLIVQMMFWLFVVYQLVLKHFVFLMPVAITEGRLC